MKCIFTSRNSVIFNGGRLEQFEPTRGLRQGDPLSPYVFLLCVEFLTILMEKEVSGGEWNGIGITRGSVSLSHLIFADDIVLMGQTDENMVAAMERASDVFCFWLGQSTSAVKSKLIFSSNTTRRKSDSKYELLLIFGNLTTMGNT